MPNSFLLAWNFLLFRMKNRRMTVTTGTIETLRGQVRSSGISTVTESEQKEISPERGGTERTETQRENTETGPAPRKPHRTKVIPMTLRLKKKRLVDP